MANLVTITLFGGVSRTENSLAVNKTQRSVSGVRSRTSKRTANGRARRPLRAHEPALGRMLHGHYPRGMSDDNRDDFPPRVKDLVAKRAGNHCSFPECPHPTSGPNPDPNRAMNTGVAAHIHAASPKGPRYDPNQTPEERRSVENAIWMCQIHGHMVDQNTSHYTAAQLRVWKAQAELRAEVELTKGRQQAPTVNIHQPQIAHTINNISAAPGGRRTLANTGVNLAPLATQPRPKGVVQVVAYREDDDSRMLAEELNDALQGIRWETRLEFPKHNAEREIEVRSAGGGMRDPADPMGALGRIFRNAAYVVQDWPGHRANQIYVGPRRR